MQNLDWLKREFQTRKQLNSKYSLRAFARDTKVSLTTLSLILAGKRTLSISLVSRISKSLALSSEEQIALYKGYSETPVSQFDSNLSVKTFQAMSDWYYLAILALSHTKRCSADPANVADALNIEIQTAKRAIDLLIRLGLLATKDGMLVQTRKKIKVDVPPSEASLAIRRYHAQNLERARVSLADDDKESRYIVSLTVPTSERALQTAKPLIDEFLQKLNSVLSDGKGRRDSVYTLAVQLFPQMKATRKIEPS